MKASFKFYLLGIVLFFIDQTTKYYAYKSSFGGFLNLAKPVFAKLLFPNYNFAFSLMVPHSIIYVLYVILLAGLIVWFSRLKFRTLLLRLGFVLIMVGALSNIADRIYLGYVRDFIYVFWGNIFNLADFYILLGILLILFSNNAKFSNLTKL